LVALQESQNVMAINDEKTFGFTVELYANYMDSVKVGFFVKKFAFVSSCVMVVSLQLSE
jgi:hypothetical protein